MLDTLMVDMQHFASLGVAYVAVLAILGPFVHNMFSDGR